MSLGDCKAPGAVVDGWWVAWRVGHDLISLLGPGLGILMKYGQGAGRGQWGHGRKPACGGVRRRRRSGEAQGFILYLTKARLLPVRFRPPIAGVVGRWLEAAGGVL